MIIVRYADDIVCGFEHEEEAKAFLADLEARMEAFALSLHPEKTRLIEFGHSAVENRKRRGLGKPETFTFLGFTHICGRTHRGNFLLERKTRRDRMRLKLKAIKAQLRLKMHEPIPAQGRWLGQVVRGYFNYHAIPTNSRALSAFRHYVVDAWRRTLSRRSQRGYVTLGDDAAACPTMAADAARFTSLALSAIRRQTPEVGAEWCVTPETSVWR